MKIVSPAPLRWLRRENFSTALAAGGALSFPVFMVMASFAIVMVSGVYQSADALVRVSQAESVEVVPLVELADEKALATDLEEVLRDSVLITGRWQPVASEVSDFPVPIQTEEPVQLPEAVERESVTEPGVAGDLAVEPPKIHPVIEVVVDRVVKRQPAEKLKTTKQLARSALAQRTPGIAYDVLMIELDAGAADPEYLGLLAVAALGSHRAREAYLIYEHLVVLEPDSEQWRVGLAISRDQIGLDAVADYERALAISEDDSALSQLARSRLQGTG